MVCVFKHCKNKQRSDNSLGLSFFRFPRNKERCEIWRKNCSNEIINDLTCSELHNRFVCELHFNKEDLEHYELPSGIKRKLLKKTALPFEHNIVLEKVKLEGVTYSVKQELVLEKVKLEGVTYSVKQELEKQSYVNDIIRHISNDNIQDESESIHCGERCSMKKELAHHESDDICTPKAICRFIQKASGALVGHLDLGQVPVLFKQPLEKNADHSYCQVMLEKLCHPNSACHQPLGYVIPDCPLIRPISPPPSDPDDSDHLLGAPSVRVGPTAVTMATPALAGKKRVRRRMSSSSPSSHERKAFRGGVSPAEDPRTTCITTTTAISATTTTSLTTTIRDWTRTSPSSNGSNKRRGPKKYRKILPQRDTKNGAVLLHGYSDVFSEAGELEEVILNMSGQGIEKLEKATPGGMSSLATTLILDNNNLQVLPMMSSYERLVKVSLADNQVDSLIWFRRLTSLKELDLSRNKLTDVDGLWKLGRLTHVHLSGNRIKVLKWRIGESTVPPSLQFVDLSCNRISVLRDISILTNLRELLLHQNELKSLTPCKKFLPPSLTRLTLTENRVSNLCDVSDLSSLCILRDLSLQRNPCMNALQFVDARSQPVGAPRPFDYRPYVLTWCSSLASLDHVPITHDERAEAKWLLREGKIREQSSGTHTALITFLSEMCPLGTCEASPDQQSHVTTAPHKPPSTVAPVKQECVNQGPSYQTVRSDGSHKKRPMFPSGEKRPCPLPPENLPCEHFIQLIEEKAKNHRLKRANESLEERLEQLALRIRALEGHAGGPPVVATSEFGLHLEIKEEEGE